MRWPLNCSFSSEMLARRCTIALLCVRESAPHAVHARVHVVLFLRRELSHKRAKQAQLLEQHLHFMLQCVHVCHVGRVWLASTGEPQEVDCLTRTVTDEPVFATVEMEATDLRYRKTLPLHVARRGG